MANLIHFIRHGDVLRKGEHRYIGATDLSLTEDGKVAVDALASFVAEVSVASVLCSPMARTLETCGRLFPEVDVALEPALREIDFGDWENLTFDEITRRDPTSVDEWTENSENFVFPNGEGVRAFRRRICKRLDSLVDEMTTDIAVVTHGGVIRSAICHLLGLPLSNYLLFDVSPASLTTIQMFGERGTLKRLNYQPEV